MDELIKQLPCVPLKDRVIMPGMIVHLDIDSERAVRAVEEAMLRDSRIFLIAQKDGSVEDPSDSDLYGVGVIAKVRQTVRLPKGVRRVLVEAVIRAELLGFQNDDLMYEARVALIEDTQEPDNIDLNTQAAMKQTLQDLFETYAEQSQKVSKELVSQVVAEEDLAAMTGHIANNLPITFRQKQKLLEAVNFQAKFYELCQILTNEVEILKIRADIQGKLRERINKNQRDYFLKEQIKLIREELGEDNIQQEIENFKEQTAKLKADREIKDKLYHEINRLQNSIGNNAESSVLRTYIETLLQMPWDKVSRDNKNLSKARETLEADHYGLEKVKERILEYLAVRNQTRKGEAPIICMVGPPGTGKTSVAKSVARALNKKFVRLSLGGVRDEAEIRGHRRTYVGAMPGRIAEGLRQAGVKNPLMLLDEIDKTSGDYRGDISSSLLEVLDPEENNRFSDHYIELPIDLSEVFFIATANNVQTIPRPLLDRMELIEVSSYTENEKFHIAKEHLIPKQIKANGIRENQLVIEDDALEEIISAYTKEAGVRTLERRIGQICRKSALRIQENKDKKILVTKDGLEEFLGRSRYRINMANEEPEIGIVRGLAWTSVGGDTLQIEVNTMPGKGDFRLTGQLGSVMRESAEAGITYIRSISARFDILENFFEKNDIHIHIPEGAVPKDGPSAGITMATAMLSAITKVPVRADVAMTGEITLRGRVLPIGGLKEKLLAAKKAGIKTVLVPEKNEPDVTEMDAEITDGLEIIFVSQMEQVLENALIRE
ncbi:MAG TPA: endopeptidase La [Lachnospiraceae bacterium]|nr:endopeptidase La [Lachnospiraceae bacterium]